MPSKDDWKARFDNPPVDVEKQAAYEKSLRVIAEDMSSLQSQPGWLLLKQHADVHKTRFETELVELKRVVMLALEETDIRAVQLKHAYKQGYLDGMKTVIEGPDDLAKPVAV